MARAMNVTISLVLTLVTAAAVILGLDDVNRTDVTEVKFAGDGATTRGQYINYSLAYLFRLSETQTK